MIKSFISRFATDEQNLESLDDQVNLFLKNLEKEEVKEYANSIQKLERREVQFISPLKEVQLQSSNDTFRQFSIIRVIIYCIKSPQGN